MDVGPLLAAGDQQHDLAVRADGAHGLLDRVWPHRLHDEVDPPDPTSRVTRGTTQGMREHLENWTDVARKTLSRLMRELGSAPQMRDAADEELLRTIAPAWGELGAPPSPEEALPLLVPVRLRRGTLGLRLFTTIATLGTPLDVTLQELRIEMLFPADEDSKRVLVTRSPVDSRSADAPAALAKHSSLRMLQRSRYAHRPGQCEIDGTALLPSLKELSRCRLAVRRSNLHFQLDIG